MIVALQHLLEMGEVRMNFRSLGRPNGEIEVIVAPLPPPKGGKDCTGRAETNGSPTQYKIPHTPLVVRGTPEALEESLPADLIEYCSLSREHQSNMDHLKTKPAVEAAKSAPGKKPAKKAPAKKKPETTAMKFEDDSDGLPKQLEKAKDKADAEIAQGDLAL